MDLEALLGNSRRTLMAATHELKAPLSLMRMYAARLNDTSLTEAQYRQYHARLLFTAEHMLQLTNGLLEGQRWQQGKLPLEPINPAVICQEVLHELAPAAHELGQQIMVGNNPRRSFAAVGHAPMLKNAVFNLVFNALKHTPAGTNVTLSSVRRGERVHIQVADTGPGFDRQAATQLNRDTEAYAQLSFGRSGSGLGLAVVKQLLTSMNGTLQIKSSAKGSCCLLSLQASRQLALPL